MALDRWIAPAVLAAALGAAALAPAPAKAQSADELTRAIVGIADVVFRGDQPYYRYGDYGANDRLVMRRDARGRPVYYRIVDDRARYRDPRYGVGYRSAPPYGRAVGYYDQAPRRAVKCNSHGKCKAEYYDPRYDRKRYGYGYGR
ncbi:MAG TPA: hypothetical protein VFE72_07310 [Lysobacter sp.]|nr:hypothetical protein [Lysobacter sp.]